MQLSSTSCRWPHGDPGEDDFFFCGQPIFGRSSYCRDHWRRAHDRTLDAPFLQAAE